MSIQADDTQNTGTSDDDAIAALMGRMVSPKAKADEAAESDEDEGADEPALEGADEDDDEPEDLDDDDEDEDQDDDDDEGQPAPKAAEALDDDAKVTVTVNGETQEVTIGSLKRLAGQEASLTRKSQEADIVGQRAAITLQGALEAVLEDLEPYKDVDWVLEGQRMDPDEFQWHRENFIRLQTRYGKVMQGAQNLESTMEARRQAALQEQAVEAVKVLSDPTTGISGWSEETYDKIMSFAVASGLPEAEVAQIVNPQVIKIINDARLYQEAKKASGTKLNMTPKNVRKGGGSEKITEAPERKQKALERKLKAGRASDDDAVAALMGRWGVKGR